MSAHSRINQVGMGSSSDVLSGALLIRNRIRFWVRGLKDSNVHGLGQDVKTGGAAAAVAARTAPTFCAKNLEKTSTVSPSGILLFDVLHIGLFMVRQQVLLSPATDSILFAHNTRSLALNKACMARIASTHLILSNKKEER